MHTTPTPRPLVSIIVPTRNSAGTLDACLASIAAQTYDNIELIVVDRDSTDITKAIATKFTPHVFNAGPERSAQRNFGVRQAKGEYVMIIDSDMQLTTGVVAACIDTMATSQGRGIIIPEESFGIGFWAQCKALERSFYNGQDAIEAVRFMRRADYLQIGGYDESMVSGEDWDLCRKIRALGSIARIPHFIRHNEGKLRLGHTLKKKYYYAQQASAYLQKQNVTSAFSDPSGPLYRYKLFLSDPKKLLRNPLLGAGMLFMKTAEYGCGGIGYMSSRIKSKRARAKEAK